MLPDFPTDNRKLLGLELVLLAVVLLAEGCGGSGGVVVQELATSGSENHLEDKGP